MTPRIDTAPLIRAALQAFESQTGLQVVADRQVERTADKVTIRQRDRTWAFKIEVKPWLSSATLGLLRERKAPEDENLLLVTRQATSGQAENLRAMNLSFVDTAGNCFVNQDGLYVFIKGHVTDQNGGSRRGDILRPAELKVLFALLCQHGLEGATYQKITEVTGVGLGTINRLFRAPEMARYRLELKGRKRRVVRKKELLQRWVVAYPERLRPKLMIGRFKAPRDFWRDNVELGAFGAQWGGEIAAKHLTHYLMPQTATIYASRQPDDLIIQHRLRKDRQGEVEILRRFWNFPQAEGRVDVVPPLLVYADLLATGDERNIETAGMIYEQYLAGLVDEG